MDWLKAISLCSIGIAGRPHLATIYIPPVFPYSSMLHWPTFYLLVLGSPCLSCLPFSAFACAAHQSTESQLRSGGQSPTNYSLHTQVYVIALCIVSDLCLPCHTSCWCSPVTSTMFIKYILSEWDDVLSIRCPT